MVIFKIFEEIQTERFLTHPNQGYLRMVHSESILATKI